MEDVSAGSLSLEMWTRELRKLSALCASEAADFEERAVRLAFYLATLSPRPVRRFLDVKLTERELEIGLEMGDVEHVARSIAGYGIQVSAAGTLDGSRYLATMLAGENMIFTAEGATPVLAMLGAWANSLTLVRGRKLSLSRRATIHFRSILRTWSRMDR